MISNILIILATIILFLFSVNKFSRSIERVAGEKMKNVLSKITNTPVRSTIMGFIINAIIQSNTALTVTLVGLVDAGLITFYGSLGVIIGSNIGNTLTSQLAAFNIMAFAPIFIVIGFLMRRFHSPVKHYSGPVFYFGLMFLSLSYLQALLDPHMNNPEVLNLIASVDTIYMSILVGIIFSSIVQSSTVTSILAIALAMQGVLNFDQAFGMVIGSGVGTTLTALIAAIVMSTAAQRTAVSHLTFNIITVILTIIFYTPIKSLLLSFDIGIEKSIANGHLLMSLLTGILLLIFYNLYARFVNILVPEKGYFHKSRIAIENKM